MLKLRKILLCNHLYIALFLLVLIYALVITLIPKYGSKLNSNDTAFSCKILEYEIEGNKLSLIINCNEKLKGTYYIKTIEEKNYYLENLGVGKSVKINGTLEEPQNNKVPYLFNYKKYLYNQKIYYLLNIEKIKILDTKVSLFYKIKNFAFNRANKFKDNTYFYAYILGDTSKIDSKIIESYRTNGISHLFALSGLHVSIFSMILMYILKILNISEFKRYVFIFAFLMLFSFIAGFSPSILRASLLFFLLGINKVFYFNIKTENILYLVFCILVLISPFIIYNMSFLLSYTTTYFLIISSEKLNSKNYFSSLFKVSLLSFISNIGLSIYYFNYINPTGIIMNLIFVPLVTYIIFPLTLIVYIFPFLEFVLSILIYVMETSSLILSKVSYTIYFPKISIFYLILYYALLILSIKCNLKALYLLFLLLVGFKLYPIFNNSMNLFYIDVGQGDSALIVTPKGKNAILIDTGGIIKYNTDSWKKSENNYSIAKQSLIPFFRKLGINKLEYLILSHGDYDHMGEAVNLVENFKVEKVIFNCGEFNDLEQDLIKVLDKKKISYYSCIKELNVDDNKLYFLNNENYGNENDNSSVVYTELEKHKFLFMGDAGVEVEQDLIEKYNLQDIDVLKVGHHGSKTSSSKDFINEINPKYSIISVGKNNRYGHPNKEVLDNLSESKIYRTDEDGSIMFKIKNNKLKIETCAP